MEKNNIEEFKDYLRSGRAEIERQKEQLIIKDEQFRAMESITEYMSKQEDEIADLREENAELKEENKVLNMKLQELQKMSTKVAEKTDHEDLLKVLRTYMNRSKNKTSKKRGWIKTVLTEMAMTAGLQLPDDMLETLDTFDDEPEKSITIEKINDIHGNDKVEIAR